MLNRPGKNATRQRVHDRIRKKVQGTAERPRLNVYRSLNHMYVGTEHLLLALLGEGKGIAAQTLNSLGVTAENARAQTLSILGTSSDGPPSMSEVALRSTTNAQPEGVAPLAVDLVLRYGNGSVVRKSFQRASDAASFLLGQ